MLSLSKILSDAGAGARTKKKSGTSNVAKKSSRSALASALRAFRDAKTDDELLAAYDDVRELGVDVFQLEESDEEGEDLDEEESEDDDIEKE